MKYTASIEVDVPREKVVQLISDPAQLPKWLRGGTGWCATALVVGAGGAA